MAETILGKVSITPRGEYDPAAQYEALDFVRYQGSGFLVRQSCRGVVPVEGTYYMLAAERVLLEHRAYRVQQARAGRLGRRVQQARRGNPARRANRVQRERPGRRERSAQREKPARRV